MEYREELDFSGGIGPILTVWNTVLIVLNDYN